MVSRIESYQSYWEENKKVLTRYLVALIIIALGVAGYLLIEGYDRYLGMVVLPVLGVIAITHPRLAVYQFICLLFSNAVAWENPVVLYVDLSACVVVCAAALDFLLHQERLGKFPKTFLNWAWLLMAIFVTTIAGFDYMLGIKPLARILLMTVTFLSVYRLSRHFNIRHLLVFFFWVGVISAAIALAPIVAGGTHERAFGFAYKTLDDLMMIAIPIGLVLYLWSDKLKGLVYLLGAGICFVELLATQSRLPIIFTFTFSCLALFLALRLKGRLAAETSAESQETLKRGLAFLVRRRIKLIIAFGVVVIAAVAVAKPELVGAVWSRFENLFNQSTGGTVRLRLVLWQSALQAFWDNPILGVGPGNFDIIHRIYQQLHLNPAQIYVRGLSAHNLVFHYLAETGLVGTTALVALLVNQFRLARSRFKSEAANGNPETHLILYVLATMFLVTAFIEAAWMWGQPGLIFVFFLALIVRSHSNSEPAR